MKDSIDYKKHEKSEKLHTQEHFNDMQPGPRGVGMAVAFDWGLATQILVMPIVTLLVGRMSLFKQFGPFIGTLLSTLLTLPFAAMLAVFGEGIRRGWRWTRIVQLCANALLFIGGIVGIPSTIQSVRQENYWPLVSEVILLVFSPLIAWSMASKRSVRWFDTVKSTEAQKRHGGTWPLLIAIWSIVGGVLQAFAASNR